MSVVSVPLTSSILLLFSSCSLLLAERRTIKNCADEDPESSVTGTMMTAVSPALGHWQRVSFTDCSSKLIMVVVRGPLSNAILRLIEEL